MIHGISVAVIAGLGGAAVGLVLAGAVIAHVFGRKPPVT